MSGIKFTILSHGFIENDLAWNFAVVNPGSVNDKHPKADWVRVPTFSVLIRHPEAGYILYDTGSCPGDEKDGRPKDMADFFPLDMDKEGYLDARLSALNLKPADISMVVISHMHWDHSGGLIYFSNTKAGQNIMVGKKDYTMGLTETHRTSLGYGGAYLKRNFEVEGLNFNLLEEDQPLVPGIDLFIMEGHTPAILGLIVKLDSGTVIFPSDAVYTAKNYGPPIRQPGIIYDTLGFERSMKKLNLLQKQYDAKIIFPHDPEQFAALKLAPYFYE